MEGEIDMSGTLQEAHMRSQIRAAWAQVVGTVVSAATVVVAIVVAVQGQQTVKHNSQTTLQQSEDSQLSTAITALGSGNAAERVAGLLLLEQNASGRITLSSKTGEPAADVFGNYQAALRIFSGYLSSQSQAFLTAASTATAPFGLGYGMPNPPIIPIDIVYAADQVRFMLKLSSEVTALNSGQPVIDLSHDELIGLPWTKINFSWVTAFMPGIDLRGAYLESSQWGEGSDLSNSYLQCADLQGADFRGANLTYADLRGANVQDADFRGAHITGANLTQLYGTAKWSRQPRGITVLPVQKWKLPDKCLQYRKFWDNQPHLFGNRVMRPEERRKIKEQMKFGEIRGGPHLAGDPAGERQAVRAEAGAAGGRRGRCALSKMKTATEDIEDAHVYAQATAAAQPGNRPVSPAAGPAKRELK